MQINGQTFTIGADPEIFMGKDGKFISAHDKIPGDKMEPFVVENGAVQVDGMALEFNIDPAENFEQFENNLNSVQNTLKEMIGDFEFIQDTSVFFDQEFAEGIPPINLELGCEADYNGWTMGQNIPPDANELMRTAGGHIHIGGFFTKRPFNPNHFATSGRLARILDETLGVYSLLWDDDDNRRKMYGKAGSFRPKPYGMEYRPMSNRWLFDPKLIRFVYDSVQEALIKMFDADYEPDSSVREIIDTSNRNSPFFTNNEKAARLMV